MSLAHTNTSTSQLRTNVRTTHRYMYMQNKSRPSDNIKNNNKEKSGGWGGNKLHTERTVVRRRVMTPKLSPSLRCGCVRVFLPSPQSVTLLCCCSCCSCCKLHFSLTINYSTTTTSTQLHSITITMTPRLPRSSACFSFPLITQTHTHTHALHHIYHLHPSLISALSSLTAEYLAESLTVVCKSICNVHVNLI